LYSITHQREGSVISPISLDTYTDVDNIGNYT